MAKSPKIEVSIIQLSWKYKDLMGVNIGLNYEAQKETTFYFTIPKDTDN